MEILSLAGQSLQLESLGLPTEHTALRVGYAIPPYVLSAPQRGQEQGRHEPLHRCMVVREQRQL
jgi:hypothetical protein